MESTPKESKKALQRSGLPAVIVTLLACALWVVVGSPLAEPEQDFLSFIQEQRLPGRAGSMKYTIPTCSSKRPKSKSLTWKSSDRLFGLT